MVGQWEEDNMNQGRHCALSPRIPLSCFNYFMLLNKLLWAGESAYSRSYFSLLWRLTILRWRCCRFSAGRGLSFCVKTVLLCPPPHDRRGRENVFSHISFYKVAVVISTWNIASPTKKTKTNQTSKQETTEGGFLGWWHYWEVTGHEGADIIVCLQGVGRGGAWLEGVDHWRQAHLYLILRPFVSSSSCFLAAMALPSWCSATGPDIIKDASRCGKFSSCEWKPIFPLSCFPWCFTTVNETKQTKTD